MLWALLALSCLLPVEAAGKFKLPPLIYVPGFTGSQLEGSFALKPADVAKHGCQCNTSAQCSSGGKFRQLWLSTEEVFKPYVPFCWLSKMRVKLTKGRYQNPFGVEMRPVNFGGFLGIEGPRNASSPPNFFDMLEIALGYKRGVDMFGAPYDWRLGEAGLEQTAHYAALRKLVESAYNSNGKRRVVILSHSMGNLVATTFLHKQTPAWRTKYVHRWVMSAPDLGGDMDALKIMVGGEGFGDPAVAREVGLSVTMPSLAWHAAYPNAFGKKPVLYTDRRNYTCNDMPQLLRDMGRPDAAKVFAANHNLSRYVKPLPKNRIEIYAVFGNDTATTRGYYTPMLSKTAAVPLTPVWGLGDGDVALPSLMKSLAVIGNRSCVFGLPGVDHGGIAGDGAGAELGVGAVLALVAGKPDLVAQYSLAGPGAAT